MSLIVTYHRGIYQRQRVVRERYMTDDEHQIHGVYQRYHGNGKLAETCNFKHGLRHGDCILYYENGKVSSEGAYRNGLREGRYISYYPDGTVHQICFFKHDKYDGPCYLFNPDGSLASVYSYRDGKKDGVCEVRAYDEDLGQMQVERLVYQMDRLVSSDKQTTYVSATTMLKAAYVADKLLTPVRRHRVVLSRRPIVRRRPLGQHVALGEQKYRI